MQEMDIPVHLIVIFSSLGALNGIVFALFLLFQKPRTTEKKILSALILAISVRVGKSMFLKFFHAPDIMIIIGVLAFMAIGPLLFFYTRVLLQRDFNFKKIHILHALAMVVFGATYIFWPPFRSVFDVIRYRGVVVYLFGYILCTYLIYLREKRNPPGSEDPFTFRWALILMVGVFIIWGAYYLSITVSGLFYLVGPVLWSFVFFIMLFRIFNQGSFQASGEVRKKYQNSTLKEADARLYYQNLLKKMNGEKLFLDPDITLTKLAGALSVLPLHLSQIINDKCRQNFSDFINSYRIEEAREKLVSKQYEHLTIAAIARECGFNSISSFNTAFKKKFRMTPSQFRPNPD